MEIMYSKSRKLCGSSELLHSVRDGGLFCLGRH